jgi:AraC-like DNA-binding protein
VWADIERFGIDALIAADPSRGRADGRRSFAVQVPELASIGVHWHDYYELGYVLDGEAAHAVNGVVHAAAPGSVFLLSPADVHALRPDRTVRLLNAVLRPELVESTLESVLPHGELGLPWLVAELPAVAEDVRRVCEETGARRPGWEAVVESSLRVVLVELARAHRVEARVDAGPGPDRPPPHVRRALGYVERHFRDPITLGQVAAVAHLSPHWFSEQFRRATGHSFQTFLKRRRLQFARTLLESTDLGVTEVCHAAGFNDPSYFGRAYRAEYGVAPSGGRSRAVT